MNRFPLVKVGAIAVAIASALALSSCDGPLGLPPVPGGTGLPAPTDGSPSPSTPGGTEPTAAPSPSSGTSTSSIPSCELFGSVIDWLGSNNKYFDIQIMNIGSGTCTITRTPTVAYLNSGGASLPVSYEKEDFWPEVTTTLNHGQSIYLFVANFEVNGDNSGIANCGSTQVSTLQLNFTPDGLTTTVPIYHIAQCAITGRNFIRVWPLSTTIYGPDNIGVSDGGD